MAAKVIIGVDPHKTTHTAVAVDDNERELAEGCQEVPRLETSANLASPLVAPTTVETAAAS